MYAEIGRKPKINLDTFTRLFMARPIELNQGDYYDQPHVAIWQTKGLSVGHDLVKALRMLESQVKEFQLEQFPENEQFFQIRLSFIPKRSDVDIIFSHKSRL